MTKSEKLLSSFAGNFFYKEFVYADLKFTSKGGTEYSGSVVKTKI